MVLLLDVLEHLDDEATALRAAYAINTVLAGILALETPIVARAPLPPGASILPVARR